MECRHLSSNVKINREFIKNKINGHSSKSVSTSNINWKCLECSSCKENWLCLHCGGVHCGRYEKVHALAHAKSRSHHNVCINTLNGSVFCYQCDDFVINDTGRKILQTIRRELEQQYDDATASTSDRSSSNRLSTSSTNLDDETTTTRVLRPRKRTVSSDSSEPKMEAPKRKISKRGAVSTAATSGTSATVMGLRNLGNTCFMNSVLQSLYNIHDFSLYISSLPLTDTTNTTTTTTAIQSRRGYYSRSQKENTVVDVNNTNILEEFRKVLIKLSKTKEENNKKSISPDLFLMVISQKTADFRGYRQHDAHEFLRYLLDQVHMELQACTIPRDFNPLAWGKRNVKRKLCGDNLKDIETIIYKGNSSIVSSVFGGQLESEVRCLICGLESKKYDPFLDLSLDIPERFVEDNDRFFTCNIGDCLSSFTRLEELTETEFYFCESCKCKQKSTKRFLINRLPKVLCLHLKRFRWDSFFRNKIDLRIRFEFQLDMAQFVPANLRTNGKGRETRRSKASNMIYDLAAVIVHHGNGLNCGHYTSYAHNNGTWLHFNDHNVREVRPDAVAEAKPYILFYVQREMRQTL